MGELYDSIIRNYENISEEEWKEIESLNEIGTDVTEYANWIKEYKNKLEIKYFELFKKARQEDKQELIEKACRWLLKGGYFVNSNETIDDFKKAMENLK